MAEGAPLQPVVVVDTGLVEGRAAIPVAAVDDASEATLGSPAIPVRVIEDADLVQNGGQWHVEGRIQPMRVVLAQEGALVEGRIAAIPVYVVSGSLANAPLPPINLTLTPTGAALDDVLVGWETQTPGATYEVWYGVNGVDYALLTTTAADATSYTHTTPDVNAARLYYQARAVDGSGESEWATASLSGLLLGLIAYWSLNEVSGTRNDSVGTNHLTDINTVGSEPAKVGNGAVFISSNSEMLENAAASFSLTGNFSVGIWFKTATQNNFIFSLNGSQFSLSHRDEAIESRVAGSDGLNLLPTEGAWYDLTSVFDSGAGTLDVSLNGGAQTAQRTGLSAPALTNPVIHIGRLQGAGFGNGTNDEAGLWNRKLSAAQILARYNGGAGLAYPFSA